MAAIRTKGNTVKFNIFSKASNFPISFLLKTVKHALLKDFYLVRVVVPALFSVPKPRSLHKVKT